MNRFICFLCFLLFSFSSFADGIYACIPEVSGGYSWKGFWELTKFKQLNALIKISHNDSVMEYKEADDELPAKLKCVVSPNWTTPSFLTCTNDFGRTVVFNQTTLRGATSAMNGAVLQFGSTRDKSCY